MPVQAGDGLGAGRQVVKGLRLGAWAWLHRAFPEAPAWLVSAIPVTASMDGAKVPWNRRERKQWRQAISVAVHLFCGKDRAMWKSRAEAAHVVTVDQAEDIMADDTYAALLDLALTGKVKMVFGGPHAGRFPLFEVVPVKMADLDLYGIVKVRGAGGGRT